jgi:hypothetical protein
MALMAISILLVFVTLVCGFRIGESPLFLFTECIINLVILLDFVFRLRLMGAKRFFEGGYWNVFDAIVVFGCLFTFMLMMISSSFSLFIFEEVSEEILLITWSLFQTLRMIFIAKKQKLA